MRAPRVPRHRCGHLEMGPTSEKENSSVHDAVLEDRVHVKRAPPFVFIPSLFFLSGNMPFGAGRAVSCTAFTDTPLYGSKDTGGPEGGVWGDRVHGGVVRWGEAKELCPRIPALRARLDLLFRTRDIDEMTVLSLRFGWISGLMTLY
jgi:hypothetical protein